MTDETNRQIRVEQMDFDRVLDYFEKQHLSPRPVWFRGLGLSQGKTPSMPCIELRYAGQLPSGFPKQFLGFAINAKRLGEIHFLGP
jgi:hypothetical protein